MLFSFSIFTERATHGAINNTNMTNVTLRNINKKYENGYEAVQNVNLEIKAGEFLVLVGPSGCGKSTLLRMIAGLETITSGELLFDNEVMNDTEPRKRDVGMVFQNYALYPHMTVAENIGFPLQVKKEPKEQITKRVHDVARMLNITDLLTRLPKQLSGGQRQRVAVGRAIARTPRVFLFDEPLSNLDARLRMDMRSEITHLQRTVGATAVYVTHDHTEAMTMGDRIAVLKDGIIMQVGTPSELYNNPCNQFVASFLGSPTINLFNGVIQPTANGAEFIENNNGIRCAVPRNAFTTTPPSATTQATLAIRAEHLQAHATTPTFTATVENIEFVGHETLLHIQTAGTKKILRNTTATSVQVGTELPVGITPEFIYLFDSNGNRM